MPLSIRYVWRLWVDRVISTPSRPYCIWNRYCKNHRRILSNFLLFVKFVTVEFNRLQCPNDKMYDDVVFADRFCYPLTMFGNPVLIGLSPLVLAHIAYETDTKSSQHSTEFSIVCMIWYGWIQSSAMFQQQDARWYSFHWSIPISIDYDWCVCIYMAFSTPNIAYEIVI